MRPRPLCLISVCRICTMNVCDDCHMEEVNICNQCGFGRNNDGTPWSQAEDQAWKSKAVKFNISDRLAGQLRGMIVALMRQRSDLKRTIQVFRNNNRAITLNHNMEILSLFPPNIIRRSQEEEEDDPSLDPARWADAVHVALLVPPHAVVVLSG